MVPINGPLRRQRERLWRVRLCLGRVTNLRCGMRGSISLNHVSYACHAYLTSTSCAMPSMSSIYNPYAIIPTCHLPWSVPDSRRVWFNSIQLDSLFVSPILQTQHRITHSTFSETVPPAQDWLGISSETKSKSGRNPMFMRIYKKWWDSIGNISSFCN